MQTDRIAVAFMNGVGNFIFFTAAIKVLKSWGYNKIDLITDEKFFKHPALMEISEGIFDAIRLEYKEKLYDKLFMADWSVPVYFQRNASKFGIEIKYINWTFRGIHEVWAYLEMIGATWKDFDGYLFEVDDSGPDLKCERPRIALANCSVRDVTSRKRWGKFPELSKILTDLGYSVILLGLEEELDGCEGVSYINKLSLRQTAKVLKQCDLLIASSTGLTVVADALNVPVLLLEGPMTTSKNHPLISKYTVMRTFISCAPCFQKSLAKMCNEYLCMEMIEVRDVIQKMLNFMSRLR